MSVNDEQLLAEWLQGKVMEGVAAQEAADAVTVEPGFECPKCGERRVDLLEWDEYGETIQCQNCGTRYILEDEGVPSPTA